MLGKIRLASVFDTVERDGLENMLHILVAGHDAANLFVDQEAASGDIILENDDAILYK